MTRHLANAVSYIVHPSIMPAVGIYTILHIFRYTFPDILYQRVLIMAIVGTYILPLITTVVLLKLGYISSLKMKKTEDRKMPFLFSAVFFYFSAQLLKSLDAIPLLYLYLMGATISVFMLLLLLSYIRVSAHTAGASGLMALLIILQATTGSFSVHFLGVGLLLLGIVGWARLHLSAHTLTEVLIGYLVGALPFTLLYLVFQ